MVKGIFYAGIVLMVLSVIGFIAVFYVDIWELLSADMLDKIYSSLAIPFTLGFLCTLFTAPEMESRNRKK